MKTTHILALTFAVSVMPIRHRAQSPCSISGLQEHTITALPGYIKDYTGARLEALSFKNDIHYASTPGCTATTSSLKNDPVAIKLKAMLGLFDLTKQIVQNVDIRGLEITFGLSGDAMVFYYTPVTMKLDATTKTYKVSRLASSTYTPQIYSYAAGSDTFTPLDAPGLATMQARQQEYMSNICIEHIPETNTFTSIDRGTSWTQDTKSVIFSFQEIFQIGENCLKCVDTQTLYLYNGSWGYHPAGEPNNVRNKHNLFISPEIVPENNGTYNVVANMAHLCPPSCDPDYTTSANPFILQVKGRKKTRTNDQVKSQRR